MCAFFGLHTLFIFGGSLMENFKQVLKRTTAVLMIAVLFIGIAPIGSLADVDWSEFAITAGAEELVDGDYKYTVENGKATITRYIGDGGDVVIPSELGGYSVISVGKSSFDRCNNIINIIIPYGVQYIEASAFVYCTKLLSINFPSSLISIGNSAFSNCYNLNNIFFSDNLTSIGDYAFSNCDQLINIIIPNSVTRVGNGAFQGCENLVSATISNKISCITERMFWGCKNLVSIEIPDSIKSISYNAFEECYSLTSVNIPDNVTKILNNAFLNCTSLIDIKIPDNLEVIGNSAFHNTGYYNDSLNWVDNVLYVGKHLIQAKKEISGNYLIKKETKSIADCAFKDCTELIGVGIPNSVEYIGNNVFEDCNSLTDIVIPDGVKYIGYYAFSGCTNLISVKIPNSIECIEPYTFIWCTNLKNITLGNNVTRIGDYAFAYCDSVTDICFGGNEDEWYEIIVGKHNDCLFSATIHFAKESHFHSYTSALTQNPSCTKAGTKNYTCSCGDSYTEEIKATGHKETTLSAKAATCTTSGLTAGKKCTVCGTITAKQQTVKATGHKEVTIPAKSATYTSTGLTAGKKCSVCGKITVAQQTIAKLTLGKVDGLKAKKVKVAKSSEITLAWNKVTGAKSYEVYQKSGSKWKKIKTTSSTSYTVKNLKADKEYQFKVRAVVDGASGAYSSVLTVETIPETTSKLTLKAGKKQLTASWSKVSDISGYEISYSTSKKFSKKTTKVVKAKKSSKKTTIKKLTKNKKYYVRIRTYKTVNGKKIYSDWSTVKNVKVK